MTYQVKKMYVKLWLQDEIQIDTFCKSIWDHTHKRIMQLSQMNMMSSQIVILNHLKSFSPQKMKYNFLVF